MPEEAWKAWLEEKGELLETVAKWKAAALMYRDASNAWEAEATLQRRQSANYLDAFRTLRKQAAEYRDTCDRLREIVESLLPEKAIGTQQIH